MKFVRFRWFIGPPRLTDLLRLIDLFRLIGSPNLFRIVSLCICLGFFSPAAVWSVGRPLADASNSPFSDPAELFMDHPFTMAPGADPAALLNTPTEISFVVDTSPPAPATTSTLGDMHAVYPVSICVMSEVITDYNNYPRFAPRVTQSRAVRTADNPPTYRQRLTLSFRVLFFGSDYDYYLTVTETPLCRADAAPDTDAAPAPGSEFGMHYRMQESLDGRLSDVEGSWYLRAVEIDGVQHTYVRYFNSIFFAEDQFGLRLALRNLGARDLKNTMDAMFREAQRRGGS